MPLPTLITRGAAIVAACCAALAAGSASADPARDGVSPRAWAFPTLDGAPPIVIGHRGASGYLPEHTLASYSLAIAQGADYIEPDLVSTKDGVLIARHEPNLIATTDVADRPEFASRKRTIAVDGVPETGWFAFDFTLAEIKTLRARQQFAPERSARFDGRFKVPTFAEVVALAKRRSKALDRTIGVFPETKHPTLHERIGLALEPKVAAALRTAGWSKRSAPVILQSFEPGSLRKLKRLTPVRRVQLVDADDVGPDGALVYAAPFDRPYDWTVSGDPALTARTFGYMVTDAGLDEIRTYADGVGPWKRYIVSTVPDPSLTGPGESRRRVLPPTDLVRRAHARGLMVMTWTFRNEARRLPADYGDDPTQEYRQFYELGVDGVFSDFPDTAVTSRMLMTVEED